MIADISQLGNLRPVEPLDMDDYADNQESIKIPAKGRYTVRAPESFPATAFGRSQRSDALTARVDPTIIGPTNEGYTLRFTSVSAKAFKRNGKTASQLGDYLRATGFRGKLADEQEQADAVANTANSTYEVDVDWRARCSADGYTVEGMERFPSDGNGGFTPFVKHPTLRVDTEGNVVTPGPDAILEGTEPLILRANAVVTRYVPAG